MHEPHHPPSPGLPDTLQHAIEAREHRRRCAAVAERLLEWAPHAASALDWDALAQAPAWLALPEPALMVLQRQTGAVLCAPALRLWIDAPRIAAARAALGEDFLRALLAPAPWNAPRVPDDVPPHINHAEHVHTALESAGAAVLMASLPATALRHAARALLEHDAAPGLSPGAAQTLVERAQALAVAAQAKEPQ